MQFIDNEFVKIIKSENFNMIFRKDDGYMATWGKTEDEDPDFCPYGPLIADIEISTICHQGCPACYKGLTKNGKNMSLETFKKLFAKLPKSVCEIAFGIGSISEIPHLFDIFKHCRDNGVIPNVTINGSDMTPELFDNLAKWCGAVATSYYNDDNCFNSINELSKRGMKQANIHAILGSHNYQSCYDLIDKADTDPRLKGLNAIVFLSLKPKGRGIHMSPVRNVGAYRKLVEHAFEKNIGIGFDSCGADIFMKAMKDAPNYKQLSQLAEKCEAFLQSVYLDVDGRVWPCSFCEDVEEPVDLMADGVTFNDVWHGPVAEKWRNKLLKNCRNCPVYNVGPENKVTEHLLNPIKHVISKTVKKALEE